MKRTRALSLVSVGFFALIGIAALGLAVNFIWVTEVVHRSIRIAQLGRALEDGYRRLAATERSENATDRSIVVFRRAGLAESSNQLAAQVASASRHSLLAMFCVAASSFGTIAAGVVIHRLIKRRIGQPITLLLNAIDHMSRGELDHRPKWETADEMGVLVSSFNHMTDRVNLLVDRLEREKQSLARRVRQATAELRALSLTDELTGLPNFRSLQKAFARMAKDSDDSQTPFTLAMVDVDHFKHINDHFGHDVGNRILAAVAKSLRDAARDDDFVARYGGDEFAIIMPGLAHLPEAFMAIVDEELDALQDMIPASKREVFCVAVTVGAARYPDQGRCLSDLVKAGDLDLYGKRREARAGKPAPPSIFALQEARI